MQRLPPHSGMRRAAPSTHGHCSATLLSPSWTRMIATRKENNCFRCGNADLQRLSQADAGPAEAAAERLRGDADAAAVVRDSPELMRLLRRAVGGGGPLCDAAAAALEARPAWCSPAPRLRWQRYVFTGGPKCDETLHPWPSKTQACAEGVAKPRGVIHQTYTFPGGLKARFAPFRRHRPISSSNETLTCPLCWPCQSPV